MVNHLVCIVIPKERALMSRWTFIALLLLEFAANLWVHLLAKLASSTIAATPV
jgi:hypothetical protein